ncbi:hypothetical protein EMPS_08664 [Entomortierella parvispora]|uniref:Nucleolus and neural progenitor protein-like N-terminal domain-containing protein n=1 Tax=Entomortierella parvispora TaxID=205924 RepID=A0A9P3HGG3_9FUNG|nr:hypothetical protein EMPS_08664 [Entomortierella parvispora]
MHYKNKNQHRQATHFARICECRRIVSRMRELDIAGLSNELVSKFYSGRSIKSLKSTKSQWDSVPCRSTVAFTMTRIIGAILLLRKFQGALHDTYGSLYQLMSKTQFMAFALITIGLCSRLSVISKAWVNELQDCYILLEDWMKVLPKEVIEPGTVDYEKELPESLSEVLSSLSATVPDTPLPSTPIPIPDNDSIGLEDGSDLGQVIQRRMDEMMDEGAVALEAATQKTPRLSDDAIDMEKASEIQPESPQSLQADSPSHSHLLAELDTVFGGSAPSPTLKKKKKKSTLSREMTDSPGSASPREPTSSGAAKMKKSSLSKEVDNIFGSGSPRGTPPPAAPKKKTSAIDDIFGSASPRKTSLPGTPTKKKTNLMQDLDDIFSSSPSPRSTPMPESGQKKKKAPAKDIDDIFGSITAPKKKKTSASSEIDGIFGPPKKKKKSPE